MRGKKGSGHFEMIVGFVFFIGFVMFMFMFISPWDNSSLSMFALEGVYDTFEEETKVTLSSVFVKANASVLDPAPNPPCFYINLPDDIFKYAVTDGRSRVTLLGGNDIDSGLSGDELNLELGEDFFRVALSPAFTDEALSGCTMLDDFELGGVVEIEVLSYDDLLAMRNKYYSDYAALKGNDLRVANIFDFAIVSENMPEIKMEPVGGIPVGVEVLAKDYVVKVLTAEGTLSNERISVRIW